ncbi:MAG TPA: protein tyrosine phosphatase family protein [Croceicoccus sp.]|nr:protein tyrosine phosphatase family protein [Croceicoccus sp.]
MTDPETIRAWQRIDNRLTTSGSLTEADLAALAAIGVTRIVNLAMPDHPDILPDEAAACAAQGIEYILIPVPFDAPGGAQFRRFQRALAGDGPVHVHCVLNWRVSAFVYRHHRETGMPADEALALLTGQWDPRSSDHPDAATWAAFIGL